MVFCFPEESEIIYSWQKQKNELRVSFRGRGMNDTAFQILYDLIQKEEQVVSSYLDLSYNDLSEISVPKCFYLHQQKHLTIDLSHNRIDVSKINDEQRKFVETRIIRTQSPSVELNTLFLDRPVLEASFGTVQQETKEMSKLVNNLCITVDALCQDSLQYFDRIQEHDKIFEKIFKSLESNMSKEVQTHFKTPNGSSFTCPSVSQLQELAKYIDEDNPTSLPTQVPQFDVLLISEDQKCLIIGEIKHELTEKVFSRLKASKAFIEDCQGKISWLQNVEDVRLFIGCEICSQSLIDKCKKEKCVFVHPNNSSNNRYQIDNFI